MELLVLNRMKKLTNRIAGRVPQLELGVVTGVGSAFPETVYTQSEMKQLFNLKNKVVNKLMDSGHVQTRHLYLDKIDPDTGRLLEESSFELREKFINGVKDVGVKAAKIALENSGTAIEEVSNLIAVTSTGFLVPGVSSLISKEMGMRDNLHRQDIVGMGCNAGMSALYSAAQSVKADEDQVTLLVCVEINSASYVKDETVRTGIVNSLFGDGAAALVLRGKNSYLSHQGIGSRSLNPKFIIKDFETFTISEQSDAMRFYLDEEQNKQSFFLSKDIPFVIGDNMHVPVGRLLRRNGIEKSEIDHYVMHTGGKAVIDGAIRSLQIGEHEVRHTRSVLRDYGNISSGSFLVSLERLYEEKTVVSGDLGLLIAMGPGSTIEAALVEFI